MMNGANDSGSIYKCSSDCCSMERHQRHNHPAHSHFNHNSASSNGSNTNNNKRKQKTKHHRHQPTKNGSAKKQTESQFHHNNGMLATTPDQPLAHANYDYILGDESNCGGDDDENSLHLGKVTISENEELTEQEDDEIGNSYSCDDTMTDDAILSGGSGNKTKSKSSRHHRHDMTASKTSDGSHEGSAGDGETCCSCSDDSCVYEEPPSHPTSHQMNKNQILRVGDEH